MSDKLNGVFDGGFSGIIYEGKRKPTMPSFIDKLAEQEKDVKEEAQTEEIKDLANKEPLGLTRANDLTSDESRVVESRAKTAIAEQQVEKEVEKLLSSGYDINEMQEKLEKKFPSADVQKYLQSNAKSIFNKYGQLGYIYLKKDNYDSCDDLKIALNKLKNANKTIKFLKGSCSDCTKCSRGTCLSTNLKIVDDFKVTDKEAKNIIAKFAAKNLISETIQQNLVEKLKTVEPTIVIGYLVNQAKFPVAQKQESVLKHYEESKNIEKPIENNIAKNERYKNELETENLKNAALTIQNEIWTNFRILANKKLEKQEIIAKLKQRFSSEHA